MKKDLRNVFLIFCICLMGLFLSTGCSVGQSACYSCGSCGSCICDSCVSVGDTACIACDTGCVSFCAGCSGAERKKTPEYDPEQTTKVYVFDADPSANTGGQ